MEKIEAIFLREYQMPSLLLPEDQLSEILDEKLASHPGGLVVEIGAGKTPLGLCVAAARPDCLVVAQDINSAPLRDEGWGQDLSEIAPPSNFNYFLGDAKNLVRPEVVSAMCFYPKRGAPALEWLSALLHALHQKNPKAYLLVVTEKALGIVDALGFLNPFSPFHENLLTRLKGLGLPYSYEDTSFLEAEARFGSTVASQAIQRPSSGFITEGVRIIEVNPDQRDQFFPANRRADIWSLLNYHPTTERQGGK